MVWANVSLFVRDTELLFSFHHHVLTEHCFQPALRSCGFLRKVCMTCRAIMNCQLYNHHYLPCLACKASCTSPAFAVVRCTWDDAFQLIPVSQASLFFYHLIMLWTILNFSQEGQERICVTFKVKLFFPFTDVLLTCPLAWHTQVSGRTRAFFQWFNHDGAARPSPRAFPSITTNWTLCFYGI